MRSICLGSGRAQTVGSSNHQVAARADGGGSAGQGGRLRRCRGGAVVGCTLPPSLAVAGGGVDRAIRVPTAVTIPMEAEVGPPGRRLTVSAGQAVTPTATEGNRAP